MNQSNSYSKAQDTQGNKKTANLNWVTEIKQVSMQMRPTMIKAKPSHQKCLYTNWYLFHFDQTQGDTFH